jgi:dTDP-4-dehydrorhamnose 3,5-epimerase
MIFTATPLQGAFIVEMEPRADERGFFARTFCAKEFESHGLETHFLQTNTSKSPHLHTLRGMHFQVNGHEEVKLLRCVKGSIQDVIVDVRIDSPTYLKWFEIELSENTHRLLYIPRGFAHGFLTLTPNVEVNYMVSAFYSPENERGLRWNDPAVNISWKAEPAVISDKDAIHPFL